ncbi:MAG: hypothetical protein NC230_09425 [Bacteroides sp.]|nr:hypothetical protein [Bacteroides sp.]
MGNTSKSSACRYILIGLIILITIFGYGTMAALSPETLISPWLPVGACVVIAVLSALRCGGWWEYISWSDNIWLNRAIHTVVVTALAGGVFYSCNYVFDNEATKHREEVVVDRRYYKVRHRTKRISRRTYGRGEPYKVYYIDVRFADGRETSLTVPFKRYKRIHNGDTIPLNIAMGLFGIPVIKRDGAPVDVPPSRRDDYSR